jgi:hypothetical protein
VVALACFLCFAALAASLLVWRAPFPAIVVSFIPFLVVSTVFQLPRPTLRAAIFLALMLAILGVLSPRRRPSIQFAGGAAVVLIAVLAAALPGVAKASRRRRARASGSSGTTRTRACTVRGSL